LCGASCSLDLSLLLETRVPPFCGDGNDWWVKRNQNLSPKDLDEFLLGPLLLLFVFCSLKFINLGSVDMWTRDSSCDGHSQYEVFSSMLAWSSFTRSQ
jgi:hypothetical protein